ncbi:MAG: hypothetical protein GX339_08220 [Tissierellia bacterium]|nr:hypothetical protein [Tissierellia bacterium]
MRKNDNVAGERNRNRRRRRRCDCGCVFECLLDLLEDALDDNNRRCRRNNWNRNDDVAGISRRRVRNCEDVFECLEDLLEDELDDDDRRR